jgi:peroxiredoxin
MADWEKSCKSGCSEDNRENGKKQIMNNKSNGKSRMKTKPTAVVTLCFICSILFAQDDIGPTTIVKVGDRMPAFKTTSLAGKPLSSDELKGKVVLINFWATWCGPCNYELPLLQKNIYDRIKDTNFAMLCISRGEEADVVQKFITGKKFTFPVYLDGGSNTWNLFATKYIPRNFVIARDGKVKWAGTGFAEIEFNEMVKLIDAELKK